MKRKFLPQFLFLENGTCLNKQNKKTFPELRLSLLEMEITSTYRLITDRVDCVITFFVKLTKNIIPKLSLLVFDDYPDIYPLLQLL